MDPSCRRFFFAAMDEPSPSDHLHSAGGRRRWSPPRCSRWGGESSKGGRRNPSSLRCCITASPRWSRRSSPACFEKKRLQVEDRPVRYSSFGSLLGLG